MRRSHTLRERGKELAFHLKTHPGLQRGSQAQPTGL